MKHTRMWPHRMADYPVLSTTVSDVKWLLIKTGAGEQSIGPNYSQFATTVAATAEVIGVTENNNTLVINDTMSVEFELAPNWSATWPASTDIVFGIADSQNDDYTSIANYALFRIGAGGALHIHTKNSGGTATEQVGTVKTGVFRRFKIQLDADTITKSPPAKSTGTPTNLRFFVEDDYDQFRRVGHRGHYSLEGMTAGRILAQLASTVAEIVNFQLREIVLNERFG